MSEETDPKSAAADDAAATESPAGPPADFPPPGEAAIHGGTEELQKAVVAAIMTCYDPEIPVDIYQLGLIYKIEINEAGAVDVEMTLTSPNCPVAGTLPGEVEQTIASVAGVPSAQVSIVWDPAWGPERMSEGARLQLGLF